MSLWKIVNTEKPKNLFMKLEIDPTDNKIGENETRLQFTEQSFLTRSVKNWNKLPVHIRLIRKIGPFKTQLKKWIAEERLRPRTPD